jgi:hypothetical protein
VKKKKLKIRRPVPPPTRVHKDIRKDKIIRHYYDRAIQEYYKGDK